MGKKPDTDQTDATGGSFSLSCPLPFSDYKSVLLAHGSGGRLTHELIQNMFLPEFRNQYLEVLHDGAVLPPEKGRLAFSTDSYVVSPIFFPGGSIAELAVNGTVNDLAMCGAEPLYLSAALIIEEGLPMEDLRRITVSMQEAAREAGVMLVTGDTKVVDRGHGDKIFITTSGLGRIPDGVRISPSLARVGDKILINGPIAEHGIAVLSVREGLEFETQMKSDTAPLNSLVQQMLQACPGIHVLRDPTRGGVASALTEIAQLAGAGIHIREAAIPASEAVRGACEILGLDPLYVANEGKLLAFVPPEKAGSVLSSMRTHPLGRDSCVIGEVVSDHPGVVTLESAIGSIRVVDMLPGEQLPRIC